MALSSKTAEELNRKHEVDVVQHEKHCDAFAYCSTCRWSTTPADYGQEVNGRLIWEQYCTRYRKEGTTK